MAETKFPTEMVNLPSKGWFYDSANPLASGAAATLSTYSGTELDDDPGEMIYVEYRAPINRASDQTEDVKLVVEF